MNRRPRSIFSITCESLLGVCCSFILAMGSAFATPPHELTQSVCTLDVPKYIGKPSYCGVGHLRTSKLSCTIPSGAPPVTSMRFVGGRAVLDPQKAKWSQDGRTLDLGYDIRDRAPAGFSRFEISLGHTQATTLSFDLVVDVVPPTISVDIGREYSISLTDSHSPIERAELIVPAGSGKFRRIGLAKITAWIDPSTTTDRQQRFIIPLSTPRASVVVATDIVGNPSFRRLDGGDLTDFFSKFGEYQRAERDDIIAAAESEARHSAPEFGSNTEEYALPLAILYVHPPGLSPSELGNRLVQLQSVVDSAINFLDLEFARARRYIPGFRTASKLSATYFTRGISNKTVNTVSILPGQGNQYSIGASFDLPSAQLFDRRFKEEVQQSGGKDYSKLSTDSDSVAPVRPGSHKQFFEVAQQNNPYWRGAEERSRLVIVFDLELDFYELLRGLYHGVSKEAQPTLYLSRTDQFRTNMEIDSRTSYALVHEIMHSFGLSHVISHENIASAASFMPIGDAISGNIMQNYVLSFDDFGGFVSLSLTASQTILLQHRIWGNPAGATATPALSSELMPSSFFGTEQFLFRERWGVGQRLNPPLISAPFSREEFPSTAGQGPCCSLIQPKFPAWTYDISDVSSRIDWKRPFINHSSFSEADWKSYMPGKIDEITGLLDRRVGRVYDDVFRISPEAKRITVGVQQIYDLLFKPPTGNLSGQPQNSRDWAQQSAYAASLVELPVPFGSGPHFLRVKTLYSQVGIQQFITTGGSTDPFNEPEYTLIRRWANLSSEPQVNSFALVVRPSEVRPESGNHYLVEGNSW